MKSLAQKISSFTKPFFAVALVVMVSGLSAQMDVQPRRHISLPQDWSHSHLLFSSNALVTNPALAQLEPRLVHQWLRQNLLRASLHSATLAQALSTDQQTDLHRDWSVSLGAGELNPATSPAKFGFDTTATPSCTSDYVVFGLNVAGSGTQANLIAFNNLYSGTLPTAGMCGTGGPSVLFAYNASTAGGRILTSPALSGDGTKIAFVESAGTSSIFHVLTWVAGSGTSATAPATPTSMVSITYAAANNTRSSPWIDYVNDIAYVGANNGRVYKITGVFKGTPTLAGAPWPINMAGGNIITSPVLDPTTSNLFVGDALGRLLSVNYVTPGTVSSLAVGSSTALNHAILDAPIVDSTNGVVYAISSNDGTGAVLVQAATTNLAQITRARIGIGSANSNGTSVNMYDGSPDNNYFTSPSTGFFLVCGTGTATTDTSPRLYTFGFGGTNGTTLNSTPRSSTQLVTSLRSRCSPITEFFNPNIGAGTDFFFLGLTIDCTGAKTPGCIMSRPVGGIPLQVNEPGGTSSIVMDNDSTAGQASSIYFTPLGAARAIKLTQSTLQ